MDDVWATSDDDEAYAPDTAAYDRSIADRDWNRLQDHHGVAGYREGIAEGKEASLQPGFDAGYSEAARIGLLIGRLRGVTSTLLQLHKLGKLPATSEHQSFATDLETLYRDLQTLTTETLLPLAYYRATDTFPAAKHTKSGGCGKGEGCCRGGDESRSGEKCGGGDGADAEADAAMIPRNVLEGFRKRVVEILGLLGWEAASVGLE
ncbi:uncharacterized protein EV422DRAFT_283157 [Fimicolochytrium jonesii]|uniref:uncharacterized protein n=1 Tax=Fimicolochytrium jonesii TaxID=1396493 RepID=UPI0022FE1CE1|nr:uncharacterized protein EV422DRAFT_283157 [Fimicolochytrium jonesii]KAI8816456.1 hypothetical protein EV422DRAFT_283157 [Fimicolochytrium jonesii]